MDLTILKYIPMFEDLTNAELEKISKLMVPKKFMKGEVLFMEGDEGNSMYIIKSGNVKILNISEDGKEKIFSIFTEGDFLGEMALIDKENRSATAEAMEDVVTYVIYKNDFLEMLKGNFTLVMKIMQTLSERIRVMNKKVEILTFKDIDVRFADVLLELIEKYGIVSGKRIIVELQLTHKDIANMLGVTRETMTRLISKMKKDGIIDIEDKKIIVLNQKKLKEILATEEF